MSSYECIKASEGDRAARLTLARPPVNVLNIAMISEINRYLETLINRTDLCVLVIDAEGKHFCAGVDVPEHKKETVDQMLRGFHKTFRLLNRLPMPVLCAAQGGAYGGGMELVMFCDLVLAADDLKIGVPEITLGVFPPPAIAHLCKLMGLNRAAEFVFTGKIVGAEEALNAGLVNHIYPAAELKAATEKLAGKLTKLSAFSLRKAREALRAAAMSDFEATLDTVERIYLKELMSGQDPSEGLAAFAEKRPPQWTDS